MAMYNNGYPASYNNPYMVSQYQQPSNNGIIWVQGEAGAKSYLIAPNTTVQLWDSESQTIYLKSADASGMPSMKVLDYTIRGEAAAKKEEYATKADLDALAEKVAALAKKKPARVIREEDEDE